MNRKSLLFRAASLMLFVFSLSFLNGKVQAQVTSSTINGQVTDSKGETLPGATVVAIHVPSGTKYGTSTNENGRFNFPVVRIGGPYTVSVSFVGFNQQSKDNISADLGSTAVVNFKLTDEGTQLSEVVVSTGRGDVFNNERTGAATNINARQLTTLPSISRSLTDFTRLTPQANGTNFGGRDGRLNSVRVDGAVLNNGFGLTSDLLPGGEAQPISLDAIQEVQVNIAPYDVRQTGFTGAGVNAVTRSGTNELTGSVYGFYRDQSFNGKKVDGRELSVAESSNKIFGARLGGAIVKNKLFFFGNFEREKYVYPGNIWVANRGNNAGQPGVARTTVEDLEAVSSLLKSRYGYDPGAYENYANKYTNESTKFLARLDWNINDKNKFTIRYNQVVGTSDQATNGNSGPNPRSGVNRISNESMAFENANYAQKNIVRSLTAELNTSFSSKLSNQFLATYSYIESTRSTPGSLFPFVDIWEGGKNYMSFGTELFSYNNGVKNNNYTFLDNVTYQAGKHTLTGGASFEIMKFSNSYVRLGTSYYRFNSVQDFLNDRAPSAYGVTYPLQSDTWANINFGMAGLYAQDKFAVTDRLNLTLGLRADLPIFMDDPLYNPAIDNLKLLDKDGNETSYSTKTWPKSRVLLSPRLGVNYDVFGDGSLQLRGGTGIFTGLIPFVYFTNQPSNSGVLQNTLEPVNAATLAEIKNFNADPLYWVNALPNRFPKTAGTTAPGTVALIDKDFKMPQVWRSNIGADYKIPGTPLVASFDFLYTKDIQATYQFNSNRKPATATMDYAGDDRDFWGGAANATYNTSTGAIVPVLSNTNKGRSMAITAGLSLPARKGFYGSLFYNYTNARDISGNPGSAANSAWSNNYSINDPNEQLLGQSQFGIPHRVVGNVSYRIAYANHLATTVSLFYQGQNAGRFAFTTNGDLNRDGVSLDLLYIPESASELNFDPIRNSAGEVLFSADQQREAFDKIVNETKELKNAKGGYIERNAGLLPWLNRFDFKLVQDIFTNIGKKQNSLQISLDIMNVGNLLNSAWGVRQELDAGSQFNYALLDVASVTSAGVPTFKMLTVSGAENSVKLPTTLYRNTFNAANTWNMQLGLRYSF
ncbi:Carboxypeptidase regulatory-like domain-containing protein [Dyadobacter koreensis]|uniref:Carboxypeptidase regulatory-like domain-containing protein n=1 Tax=Dyadobacter koreensis TaxID=408657 RepID=A0A1H6TAJ0_9BACT|nr:TonB-dependent receptor [Dyadobacter koreensis]SEI76286.1 Carboxypeptidase regulatory-like domain-containing protein [Dyadobacter koreensis]